MDESRARRRFAAHILRTTAPLVPDPTVLERMLAAGRCLDVAKRETILRAGEVADRLFFVHAGLLRYYYSDAETGDERTGQFFDEGSIVTDAASFLTGAPSLQTFEAIEPSQIFALPRAALTRAYDADHAIERHGRKLVEEALLGLQRRSANLLVLSPDERYRRFVETRPELARRVPQYLVASYLGITPESLSRLRGRMARRPGR